MSAEDLEPILSTMIFNATNRVGFIEVEAGSRIAGEVDIHSQNHSIRLLTIISPK